VRLTVLYSGADLNAGGVPWYLERVASRFSSRVAMHLAHSPEIQEAGSPCFERMERHPLRQRYSLLSLPLRVAQMRRLIRRTRADILHLHTARAGLIGFLASLGLKVGVVFTIHGWRYEQGRGLARLPYYLIERATCRRADAVALICARDKAVGVRDRMVSDSKAVVINTRIEASDLISVEPLAMRQIRSELGIPTNAAVIGMVGSLDERKDPTTFLHAAALILERCPNAWFLWVGGGPLQSQAAETALRLGIFQRVKLAGKQPGKLIPALLRSMDVFFFTSRIEGVPLGILEAQAAGVPVASSSYLGVEEVVQDGRTGLLFRPGDARDGAKAVLALLSDREAAQRMACAAKTSFFEKHAGPEKMAAEYEALYVRVAAQRKLMGR
jgi:glycosyltransferase involved in cell wall biosynthesis